MGARAGNISRPGQQKRFAQLLLEDHCTQTKPVDVELPRPLSPRVLADPAGSRGLVCVIQG